jgi:hypothetical protein
MTTTQYFIQLVTICAIPVAATIGYFRGATREKRRIEKQWKAKRAAEPRAYKAGPQKRRFTTAFLRFRV